MTVTLVFGLACPRTFPGARARHFDGPHFNTLFTGCSVLVPWLIQGSPVHLPRTLHVCVACMHVGVSGGAVPPTAAAAAAGRACRPVRFDFQHANACGGWLDDLRPVLLWAQHTCGGGGSPRRAGAQFVHAWLATGSGLNHRRISVCWSAGLRRRTSGVLLRAGCGCHSPLQVQMVPCAAAKGRPSATPPRAAASPFPR